jgi:hypothetical protein
MDAPANDSLPARAESSSLRASSQPAVATAASLETALDQGETSDLEKLLRTSISRLKELEEELQATTVS